ncbi:MAG: dihydrolipoyl dehydrogenase [Thiotrichales bacterium]
MREVDVAIIGAGTAGLNAMAQVRKAQRSFVLINGGHLGTTCARVGCMPSKALIQVAEDFQRRRVLARHGIVGGEHLHLEQATVMEHVRHLRDLFVDRVLQGSTDNLGEELIEGYARFIEPGLIAVGDETIGARRVVIAAGSSPLVPQNWRSFGDRVITTDDFFELQTLPASIAVIGLGVIGLELGQALHRLGVQVTGVDAQTRIGGLTDQGVSDEAIAVLGDEFPLWLGHPAEVLEQDDGRLKVRSGEREALVEKVLVCIGRQPNLAGLQVERLGVPLDARGVPHYNPNTMQVGDLPVYIAGDVDADLPILHEAGDEGRIAGYNAAHGVSEAFQRKTPFAVIFCDPGIAIVGTPWSQLAARDDIVVGEMKVGPVGRALIMAKNKGVIRVYAERDSGRLLGGAMLAPKAESLGHALAWCVQQQMTVFDMLALPYYHPTLEEALQAALYNLAGKVAKPPTAPLGLQRL